MCIQQFLGSSWPTLNLAGCCARTSQNCSTVVTWQGPCEYCQMRWSRYSCPPPTPHSKILILGGRFAVIPREKVCKIILYCTVTRHHRSTATPGPTSLNPGPTQAAHLGLRHRRFRHFVLFRTCGGNCRALAMDSGPKYSGGFRCQMFQSHGECLRSSLHFGKVERGSGR